MGDGINDAPALRAADIGISVDSAVDIAKEAADIILLEKSLLVLDEGVVEGRTHLLQHAEVHPHDGELATSATCCRCWWPAPSCRSCRCCRCSCWCRTCSTTSSQTGIPFDNVDAELVRQPLQWNPADIGRFMLFFGPISSVFDLTTFAVMWWVFDANTRGRSRRCSSRAGSSSGLLTQTLVVHMIRTPKLPFVQSRAAAPLMAMTLAIMAVGAVAADGAAGRATSSCRRCRWRTSRWLRRRSCSATRR